MINQKMCLLCLLLVFLTWKSQKLLETHTILAGFLPTSCLPFAVLWEEELERPLTPTLHLQDSTLPYWLASSVTEGAQPWQPTAELTGCNTWLDLGFLHHSTNPEGFFCLSLSPSFSAYCGNWGRHTATKGKEANRPGSSFTLDRWIEAGWRRKSTATHLSPLLIPFFSEQRS